jgi:hypothetical protein
MKRMFTTRGLFRRAWLPAILIAAAASTNAQVAGGGTSTGGTFTVVSKFGQPDPVIQTGGTFGVQANLSPAVIVLQTPGAPVLKLTYGPGTAIINWAVPAASFVLETTTTPHLPNSWQPVAGSPAPTNGTNFFSVPITTTRQFYRLKSQ